jgi:hypothetical protein
MGGFFIERELSFGMKDLMRIEMQKNEIKV